MVQLMLWLVTIVAVLSFGCGAGPEVRKAGSGDILQSVSAEELWRRGMALARRGDYTRAEQYLLVARDKGVPEERVLPWLVSVCVRASRLSAAVSYAEPYLERHPDDWPLRTLVGSLHYALGRLNEARKHLEKAVELAKKDPRLREGKEPAETHYLLAIVLRDQGEDSRAREHFSAYLNLNPHGEHAAEVRAILEESNQFRHAHASERPGPLRLADPGSSGHTSN
ncbi:MAG: tetratricopeptide repeat protein [Sandaracinaceae bacterium]|nr:tetratricopeptide repeat protein [Sandaracinaceae bacterium]